MLHKIIFNINNATFLDFFSLDEIKSVHING